MNDAACGDADVDFCASQAVAAPDIFQCSQPAAPAATPVARFVPDVADAADAADAAGIVMRSWIIYEPTFEKNVVR